MSDLFDAPVWEPPTVVREGLSGWTWAPGLRGIEYVAGVARLSNGTLVLSPGSDEEGPIYTRRPLFSTPQEALRALVAKMDRSIARRVAIRNSIAKKLDIYDATKGGAL